MEGYSLARRSAETTGICVRVCVCEREREGRGGGGVWPLFQLRVPSVYLLNFTILSLKNAQFCLLVSFAILRQTQAARISSLQ